MLGTICLAIVGVTLLVAGASKTRDPSAHGRVVMGYKILPDTTAYAVGTALPFLEMALGLLLLSGLAGPWPGYAAGLLFLVYTAGLVINLARGRTELDCGCFGFTSEKAPRIGWGHVVRAGVLSAVGFLGAALPGASTVTESVLFVAIAALVVALSATVMSLRDIMSLKGSRVDRYLAGVQAELRKPAPATSANTQR